MYLAVFTAGDHELCNYKFTRVLVAGTLSTSHFVGGGKLHFPTHFLLCDSSNVGTWYLPHI